MIQALLLHLLYSTKDSFWLALPACASILLLAITDKVCQDVAVIPFLWVLPLSLYLLSFIICFDNPRWYVRLPFALALVIVMAGICWTLFHETELSRSEEHTSELQSRVDISYAVFCLKKKKK